MSRFIKRLLVLGVCLTLILAVAPAPDARPPAAGISYPYELERAIYQFTNEVRQKNHVPTLSWDNSLRDVARGHSADMIVRHYFSHETPDGGTFDQRIRAGYRVPFAAAGENIWMSKNRPPTDFKQLARIVVDNWMSSPGHRTNLLNPKFTDIGVGVATNGSEIQVTQAFVRHR
jgi:uncharacterized protein YkwD